MKSIIFALIGIVMYGIQNAIIDIKLKQYSTVGILLGMYLILMPFVVGLFVYQKASGGQVAIPTGQAFGILAFVAISYFIADFFYIGAYTTGGNVVTITILLVLMPVIGALVKFLWIGEKPTIHHIVAFIFAALAVTFIAIGNSKTNMRVKSQIQDTQQIVPQTH